MLSLSRIVVICSWHIREIDLCFCGGVVVLDPERGVEGVRRGEEGERSCYDDDDDVGGLVRKGPVAKSRSQKLGAI